MRQRLIVTPGEAADMLKERDARIYQLLKSGEIPAYRSGNEWKIPVRSLEQYVENRAKHEAEARREMDKNEKKAL